MRPASLQDFLSATPLIVTHSAHPHLSYCALHRAIVPSLLAETVDAAAQRRRTWAAWRRAIARGYAGYNRNWQEVARTGQKPRSPNNQIHLLCSLNPCFLANILASGSLCSGAIVSCTLAEDLAISKQQQ